MEKLSFHEKFQYGFVNETYGIICRHGLKQYRNGWADGPAYITQCPIKTGNSYVYDFNVTGQRGTLWWHAHIFWLRATVYGAVVIMPKQGTPFPFPQPEREENILLGELARLISLQLCPFISASKTKCNCYNFRKFCRRVVEQ